VNVGWVKELSIIKLMDCKNADNKMLNMIREHSELLEMWLPIKGFDNQQVSTKGSKEMYKTTF
jgi:hypothetical protein